VTILSRLRPAEVIVPSAVVTETELEMTPRISLTLVIDGPESVIAESADGAMVSASGGVLDVATVIETHRVAVVNDPQICPQ
jgi:hypothetical protein